jgi:hypothetical protein
LTDGRKSGRLLREVGQFWPAPLLAGLMLLITILPAQIWKTPTNDAVYTGFDPNLIYATTAAGGSVALTRGSINIDAPSGADPTVLLATTLLPKLIASVEISAPVNAAKEAFRLGFWSPWTNTGYFVVFGPAPENLIQAATLAEAGAGPVLLEGAVVVRKQLGHYRLASTYQVTLALDKSAGTITSTITGSDGTNGSDSVGFREFPAIFGHVQVSLVGATVAGNGTSRVALSHYVLTVPHQKLWASKVDDPMERVLLIALTLVGLLMLILKIFEVVRARTSMWRPRKTSLRSLIGGRLRMLLLIAAVGIYLIGNALLFPLGGHPFDMGAEKLYAYVARGYGPDQLYYLPNLVSLASVFGGIPYLETAFPYEPVTGYLSSAIGGLGSVLFAGGGMFSLNDVRLEYLIKAVNVLFGLADSVLIYFILRTIRMSERWSLIASAMFLFNPAVWFSMSIWGQTHVVSLFFVLAALLFAERRLPMLAWFALALGLLTRPQMVVFGLLISIVLLRKFAWKENVGALSWAVILTFLLLVPFTLATSPSLPIDIMLNNFHVQEGTGNTAGLNTVSQTAYSIWPLVTYVQGGASGIDRAFLPSSTILIGSWTYQLVSQVLTVAALVGVVAVLLLRRTSAFDWGAYIPLVAVGIASFLMLLTGVVATHFLLALPLLLLCRRWVGTGPYVYIATIWTVTTFVPMFGSMGMSLTPQDYPLLAPAHNAVTKFFVSLYASDRFITVAVVANACAVVWLAAVTFSQGPKSAAFSGSRPEVSSPPSTS